MWTLDEIVFMYNIIQSELNRVERPLVANNIKAMDQNLEPGIKSLTWESEITPFLKSSKKMVEKVYTVMQAMKTNLNSIYKHLQNKKVVIYERKLKSINFEDLLRSVDNASYNKRKEIEEELKKIHDD